MSETIQVVLQPMSQVPVTGDEYYHETLLYTNSSGQQYVALGYAMSGTPTLSNFTSAIGGGATSFGPLLTQSGEVVLVNGVPTIAGTGLDLSQALASTNISVTVLTGANLSSQWNTITAEMSAINSKQFNYSPLTLNSNSAANTALNAAGIPLPPTDTDFMPPENSSVLWTPAGGNILETNLVIVNGSSITFSNGDQGAWFNNGDGTSTFETYQGNGSGTLIGSVTVPTEYATATPSSSGFTIVGSGGSQATVNSDGTISVTAHPPLGGSSSGAEIWRLESVAQGGQSGLAA
jgi:hypothetical protein